VDPSSGDALPEESGEAVVEEEVVLPEPPADNPLSGSAGVWDSPLSDGTARELWLSHMAGKKYLIVDLSSIDCSACVSLATDHNKSAWFESLLAMGNCGLAVVVKESERRAWARKFRNGPMGERARGVTEPLQTIAARLGITGDSIPSTAIIDLQGQVVAEAVGEFPAEMDTLCR
jgi:hypothetical protein